MTRLAVAFLGIFCGITLKKFVIFLEIPPNTTKEVLGDEGGR
jgi:hypothetical protein